MTARIAEQKIPKLIADTAREFAGSFYDENRTMAFRMAFPNQDAYVRDNWPYFVKQAREILSGMLAGEYSEKDKREIYEALMADRARQLKMPRGATLQ